MQQQNLYEHLKNSIGFGSKHIASAFQEVDRADFVLPEYKAEAYADYPLPIGLGQTISQPSTVLMMLNWLNPKPGEHILDVGSGSGWTTALLAEIAGKQGSVLGLEIIPELVELGTKNLERYRFSNAEIRPSPKSFAKFQPGLFDKILVSAAAQKLPHELVKLLKTGGLMVVPVQDSVFRIEKISETEIKETEYPGFAFVPLK